MAQDSSLRPELTEHEAADMLNIAPHAMIRLLDERKIERRKIGLRRLVPVEN